MAVSFFVAAVVLFFSLPLSDSLLCCHLVLSPTATFLSTSGKKGGKETPQGTDGPLTPLRGYAAPRQ